MCRKIYGKPLVCAFSFIMFLQAFFLFRNFTKFLCRSLSFTTFIVHAEIFLYLAKCPLKEWEGGLRLLTPCFFNFAEGGCDMTGDSGFLDVVPRDVELYGGSSSGSAVICDNGMSSYGLPINLHNGTGGMVMPESVSSNFDESVIVASPTSDSQQGASEATEGIDEDVQHQAIANPQPLPTTMDASAYDRFLHEAHLQNNRKCMPQLPWETGILAAILETSNPFIAVSRYLLWFLLRLWGSRLVMTIKMLTCHQVLQNEDVPQDLGDLCQWQNRLPGRTMIPKKFKLNLYTTNSRHREALQQWKRS